MGTVVFVVMIVSALVGGFFLGAWLYTAYTSSLRKREMRNSLGSATLLEALSISLECTGISRKLIEYALRLSRLENDKSTSFALMFASQWNHQEETILHAGLEGVITKEGFGRTRMRLCLGASLMGALLGGLFSGIAMGLGALAGFIWGFSALPKALKEEAQCRSFVAEKQLSQMIEIVILGLKSGMTFDRSLLLFHKNFQGAFSSSLALAQGQWSHGLVERSEGLRTIARSYDSPLFERLAENVIRSLRFGTSLAENLSILAAEARAIRKSKLEEKVAKAPVKMLLPVGTLILPAMLILIMGPIMLDLMQGF